MARRLHPRSPDDDRQHQYAYKVRDAEGRFREGKVKADNETAVAEKLMAMGYVPLEVKAPARAC